MSDRPLSEREGPCRLDPLTMRYLHAAELALKDALRQTQLGIERARHATAEDELRVLYALAKQDDARINLRRALKRLETRGV